MVELRIDPVYSDEQIKSMEGITLSDHHCKTLIDYDCDVYCSETGNVIAKFRKNVIPESVYKTAYNNLLIAARSSRNRSTASGKKIYSNASVRRVTNAGYVTNTTESQEPVNSGIIGSFDRNARFPYCRQTAFNLEHFNKFKKAYPIIKYVDDLYAELMPNEYALQKAVVDQSSKDFVINGTAFSTVTVNKNWQTSAHYDSGDFKQGFGNLTAIRKGKMTGCYTTLVKWGVGFDVDNGDILLMDVHQLHGNTPFGSDSSKNFTRLSLVMYYRENIKFCGTAEQELERAKNRSAGQKINE